MDDKQQEAKLDIYQSKSNHKPFDTINLVLDRIQIESHARQIKKLTAVTSISSAQAQQQMQAALEAAAAATTIAAQNGGSDNIYEEVNDELATALIANNGDAMPLPNFDNSSLVLLLHNSSSHPSSGGLSNGVGNSNSSGSHKIMLKIAFSTFSAKNLWYLRLFYDSTRLE